MDISSAELFLAYRQAKISVHQEQQGPGKFVWARAERNLPATLNSLRRRLDSSPGWFSGVNVGKVWLLPKKAVPKRSTSGVTNIGGDYRARLVDLSVRPHVTPSPEFATIEVLWLWRFG